MISAPTEQRPLRLWQFVSLGYMLHEMESWTGDAPLASPEQGPPGVIECLRNLLGTIQQLELRDTDGLARFTIGRLEYQLDKLRKKGEITLGMLAGDFRSALAKLLPTLHDEASRKYMYPVMPTHGDPLVDRFIDEPRRLFGLQDYIKPPLPPEVDAFLAEAGRCLAIGFDLAGIHFTLLATEEVVKYYYQTVTGAPLGRKTWGELNRDLEKSEYHCPGDLITDLNNIVESYRNPAFHGRLATDRQTASRVWSLCGYAVEQIIDDLIARKMITVSDVMQG